ncbi:MAG: alpha/beta hydrolase-fold protein [Bacilli bacterium]|jgi:predicted alpha/beta superfamily hydrolase|nr:alpha/beta hydrolase-fold protein [Bacilli bacterium]
MNLDTFLLSSSALGNTRKIRVYYPDDLTKRYPVLYVHDGEFCFREDTPLSYECLELDIALKTVAQDLIIVSIEAMPWQIRTREYSPFPWIDEAQKYLPAGQELGDVYLEWLINNVKPLIESKYPVYTDYQHTYMMGCSLGALISIYASAKYANLFSKIGLFSLASWGNHKALLDYLSYRQKDLHASYFIRVGDAEGTPRDLHKSLVNCYVPLNEDVVNHLTDLGVKNLDFKVNPGRFHKTIEWAKDMPEFISWLFN